MALSVHVYGDSSVETGYASCMNFKYNLLLHNSFTVFVSLIILVNENWKYMIGNMISIKKKSKKSLGSLDLKSQS